MSRLSAAERRQQNVGSRASAAARGHGRACRRCDGIGEKEESKIRENKMFDKDML